MATIDILGVTHTYELTAPTRSPDVLVFIHGWLLSRQYWLPLIQELSSKYQCLSYDLRGFGESALISSPSEGSWEDLHLPPSAIAASPSVAFAPSSLPESQELLKQPISADSSATLPKHYLAVKYTPAAYAHDLAILLQKLNIKSAWLVGHSLGGSIALWTADHLGGSVKGVICLNSGGGIYLKEEFERFRSAGQRILQFRPAWLAQLPLIDWLFSRANVAQPISRCWGRQRIVDFISAHPEAALGALLETTTPEEVHLLPQVITRLQQPVYFITGKQDSIMEPKYVRHLASFHAMFKAGKEIVIEIPDCGHLSMIEQTQAISTQLQTILQNHP
jgi:pimeloyl-ACP methyl ester carboxylesterase